ncbi:type VI secretion system membrane subunit TssM [Erwinia tracheiphila]|uniref:Type VI secretion protein n=2 Tax=Erwinia tracheiphila TaxID=65700 RepID=A0A0M2KHP5_9GAMM|nr:type VI secretion system membrane subunit TssM [Erwinia tracheiphila]EOS94455.1 type VI secretion protein IcmF [Erwinia tracheiphila PSU-1]KKF36783.1 type VI secretion protein [Erwinia tracheiphila]UIA88124.1 type VI secretion system membrane subunit TssM [Erwinia tracheiphila]UIA96717.1 type VI secretion system membrane subunit TssM [Erwinia tracheiphila]
MFYLNRLFSRRFTKALMVITFFALLIAAIWFIGPFLGFGETRPLESIESRVIFILIALLCLVALWFNAPFFLIVVATVCGIVWVIGPYIFIGDGYPLADMMARLIVIGAIFFLAIIYGVWKLLLALRNNPKLLDTFFSSKEHKPEEQVHEINAVIRDAVDYIKKTNKNAPLIRRLFQPKKSLNDLPWYMVIGAKGAGKTSAILNSGQSFPRPEQLSRVCKENASTENCECWFANQALFIDTAGKYIDEAHGELSEWKGLLKSIRKYRPVKALNGVIVTVSVSDIMGRNKAELYDISSKIRSCLDDTRKSLGVHFPVYVLVTKLDQLHGFAEYFRILTEQEREQIWGVTFPYGDNMKTAVAELRTLVESELSLLENRIERNMTMRQQEEYENGDRKKMYALPQDFRLLNQAVIEILQNIFFVSRYDESQSHTSMRGVYFSSSHQPQNSVMINNCTLIQKWRNFITNQSREHLAWSASVQKDTEFLIKDISYGRQYFLRELFSEVIVKDATLVRHNLRVVSKYRFQNFFGHCLCLMVGALLLNGFYESYHNNGAYLDAIDIKVGKLENNVQSFLKTTNQTMLPVLLNLAQYLPEFSNLNIQEPDLDYRYGLYVGKEMDRNADGLYHFFLRKLLFPMIESDSHNALRTAVDDAQPAEVYNKLKLYLMISGQGQFNLDYVITHVTDAWDSSGKIQPYQERSLFMAHLRNLFSQPSWREYGEEVDKTLLTDARELLNRNPHSVRLYERVKSAMQADAPDNLTLNKITDEQAGQIFTSTDSTMLEKGVPGLFTYNGYHQIFKKKLSSVLKKLDDEDRWIMGNTASAASLKMLRADPTAGIVDPTKDTLTRLYLQEYTQTWQKFLQSIRLRSDGLDNQSMGLSFDIYMMRKLVSSNSPLINLAKVAVKETTLAAEQLENLLKGQNIIANNQLIDAASKVNLALAAQEKIILRRGVDDYFASLREFVGGEADAVGRSASGTRLATIIDVLNEQYTQLVISDSAIQQGNLPEVSDIGQRLSAESAVWPDPFKYIIAPLLTGAYKRVNYQVVSNANKTIAASLGEVCRTTLQGRYPFVDTTEEVSLRDFEQFFAVGGIVDDYFMKNLADKVDTSTRPWRYERNVDVSSSEGLGIFELTQQIQKAFFQNGNNKLAVNYTVAIPYMSPTVSQLTLNFDGNIMTYAHGPVMPKSFNWPGKRSESIVSMSLKPRITLEDNGVTKKGPWALMRWLDTVEDIETSDTGQPVLIFDMNNRQVKVEVTGLTYKNELIIDLLKNFNCP